MSNYPPPWNPSVSSDGQPFQGSQPGNYQHSQYPSAPPPARPAGPSPVLGIIAIVLGVVALAPFGVAAFNAVQGVRLADDSTLPLFIRALLVESDARRVLIFSIVASVFILAGVVLGVLGRRVLPAKIALGMLGFELLALAGLGVYARKIPSAAELRTLAEIEKAADADAVPTPPPAEPKPQISDRQLAYTLGTVVGQTVLGRANGAAADVVQRQTARANTLATGLGVTVPPFPELTGKRVDDDAAGLDYILARGGKDLTQRMKETHGDDGAALLELGMKTSIARMMYLPRSSTNASFIAVFERTSKTANLKTATVAAAIAKIKSNASRPDVYDALDAMEDAIKAELKNESSATATTTPATTTTITSADLPAASAAPAAAAAPTTASSKPAAPKTASAVRGGAAQVNGRLPPEVISRIVRHNFGRFRLCYENGLRINPNLQGKVTTKFVIDRSGAVSSAADGGSDIPDRAVIQCGPRLRHPVVPATGRRHRERLVPDHVQPGLLIPSLTGARTARTRAFAGAQTVHRGPCRPRD